MLDGTQQGPLRTSMVLENAYYLRAHQPVRADLLRYPHPSLEVRRVQPDAVGSGLVTPPEEDELYDLQRDPYELHNVAASRPLIDARLRKLLAKECSPTPPGWAVKW